MPRLVIKVFGDPGEDVCELEEARLFLSFVSGVIVVEGQRVRSFDELFQLVSQERFRDKDFIEVVQVPPVEGGEGLHQYDTEKWCYSHYLPEQPGQEYL
jgi:hypothetical protein